jgi:ASC-1-like (ASCH) protein
MTYQTAKFRDKRGEKEMLHKMKLQHSPFQKMQKGSKTIELRLYDEKRQKVQVGDQIEFTKLEDGTQKLLTQVVALHRFESFEKMFRELPADAMGYSEGQTPKAEDMEQYYSKEEQALYGVIGIEIDLVERNEVQLEKTGR